MFLFVSRSGEADNSPGQGVIPVKGSLGGEPGGPYNLLITGVNPTFHFNFISFHFPHQSLSLTSAMWR